MTPLVTIVIPTYNGRRYLAQTIASVALQSRSDWELIVVDDASKDGTAEVAAACMASDTRMRLIRRSTSGGSACPARNAGYRAAHPDSGYLLFLDHDDLLKPDALSVLVDIMQRTDDVTGVHGLVEFIDADGIVTGQQGAYDRFEFREERIVRLQPDERTTFWTMATACCIKTPGCVLVRRRCLGDALPFPDDDPRVLDWDGWLHLTRRGPLAPVMRVTTAYRHSPGQMSADTNVLWDRLRATRRRIAASSAFTEEQRRFILAAERPSELGSLREKLGYAAESLRRGDIVDALRQAGRCARKGLWLAQRGSHGV